MHLVGLQDPPRPPRRLSRPAPAEREISQEKASGQAIQPRTFTTTKHFHSMFPWVADVGERAEGIGQRVEESGEWRDCACVESAESTREERDERP